MSRCALCGDAIPSRQEALLEHNTSHRDEDGDLVRCPNVELERFAGVRLTELYL